MYKRRVHDSTPQPYLQCNSELVYRKNLFTCKNVRVEPQLQVLSGETLSEKTANKSDQGRADVNAHGFWLRDQVAFFDVRIFNPTVKRYVHHELPKLYEVNKKEKKKHHNEGILQVEHGTFAPLVMFASEWRVESFMPVFQRCYPKKEQELCVYCLMDKKKNKLCFAQILFVHVYVFLEIFTQGICFLIKCWCNSTILLSFIYYIHCMLLLRWMWYSSAKNVSCNKKSIPSLAPWHSVILCKI